MKRLLVSLLISVFLIGCAANVSEPPSPEQPGVPPTAPRIPLAGKTPIYSVARDDNKVAISFDAAWGSEFTRPILAILDEYQIKTTFFVVKFWVEDHPEAAREIVERGHEIGNHSATHPEMGNLSAPAITTEITSTHQAIKEATGFEAWLFRPPFGHYSPPMLATIAGLGYYAIQWDVDSLDWKERGVEDIVLRVVGQAKPGSIILFHNNAKYITAALPRVLDGLQELGLEVVPISQLIYYDGYSIDHEGCQRRTSQR